MIKSHIDCINFIIALKQINDQDYKDERVKAILLDLFRVSAFDSLVQNNSDIFETGYFIPEAITMIKQAKDRLLTKLRPQLIPIAEASITIEGATNIGNKYGDIYELQLEQAMNSSLNKVDVDGVPPMWETHMKPFLHDGKYPKL